jgi:hypothetical protein
LLKNKRIFLYNNFGTLAHETFAEGQKNFMPAEPLFLAETPQIPALSGSHSDK